MDFFIAFEQRTGTWTDGKEKPVRRRVERNFYLLVW